MCILRGGEKDTKTTENKNQQTDVCSAAYNVTLAARGMALAAGDGAGASLKLLGECLGLTFENIWSCFKGRFATKVFLN